MKPNRLPVGLALLLLAGCATASSTDESPAAKSAAVPAEPARLRVALFNIRELGTEKIYDVDESGRGRNPQALAAAQVIRRVRPDILVLNEIDHDFEARSQGLDWTARRFRDAYLAGGSEALDLPYSFAAPCNTGLLSGLDLDGDGRAATEADRGTRAHGNDSWGYGAYPGQYSMAVLSRFPIREDDVRTFQKLRWRQLSEHHMPPGHFPEQIADRLRLSSKSHWDVPIEVGGRRLHLFVSHPTPQGFDGEEDKNGRRNFDEIKLWVDYLAGSDELVDDHGAPGGYRSAEPFVIIGDLNAKPLALQTNPDGPFRTSTYDGVAAIDQLLEHPRIQDSGNFATSAGALRHKTTAPRPAGGPEFFERSTSVFGNGARIDYVLPSTGLKILDGGVFWPAPGQDGEGARWADEASDHRLVWLDLAL